jgi:hypothetical protein
MADLSSLPGTARWEAFLLREQEPQVAHFCGRLCSHAQEFMNIVHMTDNHAHDGFQNQAIWVHNRMPTATFPSKRGHRQTSYEFD